MTVLSSLAFWPKSEAARQALDCTSSTASSVVRANSTSSRPRVTITWLGGRRQHDLRLIHNVPVAKASIQEAGVTSNRGANWGWGPKAVMSAKSPWNDLAKKRSSS